MSEPGAATGVVPVRRRGSEFSDKQMHDSVKYERAVEVRTHSGGPAIKGWLYGMDDYHWGVVTEEGVCHLLHKNAPAVKFLTETLADQTEDVRSLVNNVVEPYRLRVLREIFRQPVPIPA